MYNPRQARGVDGKFLATGASKLSRAARSKANKSAHRKRKPKRNNIRIDRAASRRQRGLGISGLKQNFIPYARISKRSTTVGANTGSFIPGTNKRVVFGQYARIETVQRKTGIDAKLASIGKKLAPKGSKRNAIAKHIAARTNITNPALRYSTPGTKSREGVQVRLGTSRKAGPTIIVRRGTHKRTIQQSKSGIAQYNKRMNTLAGRKSQPKPRPTRRRQAAAKRNKKRRNT
jgi:hypothetical protein